jgi:hypothetical protein
MALHSLPTRLFFPLARVAVVLSTATSLAGCIVMSSSMQPISGAKPAIPHGVGCPIDRMTDEKDLPAHEDLAVVRVVCANGRDRDMYCWKEVQAQACRAGADFVHDTQERLQGQGVVITTTAARTLESSESDEK